MNHLCELSSIPLQMQIKVNFTEEVACYLMTNVHSEARSCLSISGGKTEDNIEVWCGHRNNSVDMLYELRWRGHADSYVFWQSEPHASLRLQTYCVAVVRLHTYNCHNVKYHSASFFQDCQNHRISRPGLFLSCRMRFNLSMVLEKFS